MSKYILFDKETTKIVYVQRDGHWVQAITNTEPAMKALITRLKKAGKFVEGSVYDTIANFGLIEKTEVKKNLMTGVLFTQSVNTPRSCDPSTELYWSM